MTELEAVIGREQLKKLDAIVSRRRELVSELASRISDLRAIRLGKVIDGAVSSYWLILVHVDVDRLTVDKETFARAVAAEGIPVDPHYDHIVADTPWFLDRANYGKSQCPWSCPFYGREIDYTGRFANARRGIAAHMILRLHEGCTLAEVEDTAAALTKVESAYLR